MLRSRFAGLIAFGAALGVAGCPKPSSRDAPDAGAAVPSASPSSPAEGGTKAEVVEPDDEVQAVYPADAGPPDPLASRLCAALHGVQESRRASCCQEKAGIVLTQECTRTLTAALASKAISIEPGDVEKCEKAIQKTFDGCDWVGPFPPEAPDECLGILKGQVAQGKRCRSSLECAGDMRCHGLSPTRTGRCGAPAADAERCGGSADTLVSYTRQSDADKRHPECKGYCNRSKCAPLVEAGGACTLGAACGPGKLCVAGKCASATPGKAGDACPGGECEKGVICAQGKCVARKPAGAACAADFECLGGCIRKDAGAKGACGKKCSVR